MVNVMVDVMLKFKIKIRYGSGDGQGKFKFQEFSELDIVGLETRRFTCSKSKWSDKNLMKWNLTVSDQCCKTCNNTVVPIDTYIDTVQLDNKCSTVKTQYCRKIPNAEKPEIVTSIKHKHCCADSQGKE